MSNKTKPPVIISKKTTEEMADRRLKALQSTEYKNAKLEPAEVDYWLSMLEVFDRLTRPNVPLEEVNIEGAGRPFRYTPLQMYETIFSYFQISLEQGRDLTMGSLAMFCDMSKSSFADFVNNKNLRPEYQFIKKCVGFVENYIEYTGQKKNNPAFQIFWLKNHGWKDKFEVEATSTLGALTEEERAEAQKRIQMISETNVIPTPR